MISGHVSAMDRPSRSFVPSLNVKKRLTSMAGPWVITVVSFSEPKKKKKTNETVSVGGCTSAVLRWFLSLSLSLSLCGGCFSSQRERTGLCQRPGHYSAQVRAAGQPLARASRRESGRGRCHGAWASSLFSTELGSPLDRTSHTRGLITYCFFRAIATAALRSSNLCSLSPLAAWTWTAVNSRS